LFVGRKPETVDYSDPALPAGFDAEKLTPALPLPLRGSENADGKATPA
jgi:hypothetical protein